MTGRARPRNLRCWVSGLVIAVITVVVSAPSASAHGNGESDVAGDLVRQAIALIVNTPDDHEMIADKINDALNSTETEGVDISSVAKAKDALESGDLHTTRALLEVSIGAQPHMTSAEVLPIGETSGQPGAPPLATGSETGINVTTDALAAHRRFDAGTWAALVGLVALAGVGIWLAVRYRPPVSMRRLRSDVAPREA